jgi:uncharacterized protein YjbI with pentapeptide repeats
MPHLLSTLIATLISAVTLLQSQPAAGADAQSETCALRIVLAAAPVQPTAIGTGSARPQGTPAPTPVPFSPDLLTRDLLTLDLAMTDLRGCDLRHLDLSGAKLFGSRLAGARLDGVNLRGADLRLADLTGASLRGADLRDADLSSADLAGADSERALWEGAVCPNEMLAGHGACRH